ncbi:MAG: polysaccharide biosynthesis tyrosine autokinase [Deltaproteobacteria bacterium]|nr:polysaccharide biosynthesis tyrosine autokinase [Deltaproteobacteria bacterium]
MKQTIKKNYYELLDVRQDSSLTDIEGSYRRAMKIYNGDSTATYSLYTAEEKKALLGQINEAYETLRDPHKKSSYDAMMTRPVDEDDTYEVDINELRGGLGQANNTFFKNPPIDIKNVVKLDHPFSMADGSDQMIAEQYRILYTKLDEIRHDKGYRSFSVTSAVKGEGKSVTSLNLAYLMASDFKKRTILVEGDLRKPSTVMGGVKNHKEVGLVDVLSGKCDLHSVIANVEGTSLYILPAGSVTKNSSELIGSPAMKSVMNALKSEFEFIILDSPPVLPLVDMSILSKLVDGLLFVVRAGQTSRDLVVKALDSISNANVLGIVLNGADTKLKKYYY